MKKNKLLTILYVAGLLFLPALTFSQNTSTAGTAASTLQNPAAFTGAPATLDSYKAPYVVNSSDEKRVKAAFRNLRNALNDPSMKGRLEVELIVFGDGVEIYKLESLGRKSVG